MSASLIFALATVLLLAGSALYAWVAAGGITPEFPPRPDPRFLPTDGPWPDNGLAAVLETRFAKRQFAPSRTGAPYYLHDVPVGEAIAAGRSGAPSSIAADRVPLLAISAAGEPVGALGHGSMDQAAREALRRAGIALLSSEADLPVEIAPPQPAPVR